MISGLKRLAAATALALAAGMTPVATAEAQTVYNHLDVPIQFSPEMSGLSPGSCYPPTIYQSAIAPGAMGYASCNTDVSLVIKTTPDGNPKCRIAQAFGADTRYVVVSSRGHLVTCRICDSNRNVISNITFGYSGSHQFNSRYENCDGTSESMAGLVFGTCTIAAVLICPNANLSYARLMNLTAGVSSNLEGANLTQANLDGASLLGVYLTSANLTGASLAGASLKNGHLSSANFSGANLKGTILAGANLVRANLKDAVMDGHTDLTGTSLSYATWIDGRPCAVGSVGVCK